MNIEQITADPDEARRKVQAYRARLKQAADAEYEAALKAYRELEKGKALISLQQAFEDAGRFADGRPRLAVARADRKQVRVLRLWRSDEVLFYAGSNWNHWSYARRQYPTLALTLTLPGEDFKDGWALVPMVPADVRQVAPVALRNAFVLWEVEAWADRSLRAEPDRDPLLLTHLAGDLYCVEAAWDLTDVERMIMRGRRET